MRAVVVQVIPSPSAPPTRPLQPAPCRVHPSFYPPASQVVVAAVAVAVAPTTITTHNTCSNSNSNNNSKVICHRRPRRRYRLLSSGCNRTRMDNSPTTATHSQVMSRFPRPVAAAAAVTPAVAARSSLCRVADPSSNSNSNKPCSNLRTAMIRVTPTGRNSSSHSLRISTQAVAAAIGHSTTTHLQANAAVPVAVGLLSLARVITCAARPRRL
jgi:hypothetical protein